MRAWRAPAILVTAVAMVTAGAVAASAQSADDPGTVSTSVSFEELCQAATNDEQCDPACPPGECRIQPCDPSTLLCGVPCSSPSPLEECPQPPEACENGIGLDRGCDPQCSPRVGGSQGLTLDGCPVDLCPADDEERVSLRYEPDLSKLPAVSGLISIEADQPCADDIQFACAGSCEPPWCPAEILNREEQSRCQSVPCPHIEAAPGVCDKPSVTWAGTPTLSS